MKKAYEKALKVIDSCTNQYHVITTYNYIWNFRRLYANNKTCVELTKKLHNKCRKKRKILGNGD